MNEYGSLSLLVATATSLMAATGAIILLVRRGGNWEPLQENLGKGARNIGAVITAVGVGLIWASLRSDKSGLIVIAISSGVAVLLFLLTYSFLLGMQAYKRILVVKGKPMEQKVIGGFKLTQEAKKNIASAPLRAGRRITLQEYFEGVQYNSDHVWTRPSLEFAKVLFIICYVGLITCGTIALSATALRIALETP